MPEKSLTGDDYIHMPIRKLVAHPEFSRHALNVANAFLDLNTHQLEQINIAELKKES